VNVGSSHFLICVARQFRSGNLCRPEAGKAQDRCRKMRR
jgi:hypothetical protein